MKKLYRAHVLSKVPADFGTFINPYLSIDRRPRDSSKELHALADAWFENRFGLRFRSKALFCFGNLHLTHEYCDLHHGPISIKPIGDYQLCYARNCKDMYRHFQKIGHCPWQKDEVWAAMDALQYQFIKNSSCDVAANSGNEIMIYAKSFQYVRENY